MENKTSKYRILSLDGGGISGIFQAVLLARISEVVPVLIPSVRLFSGTSIGGISALHLAKFQSAKSLVDLYKIYGVKIFKDTLIDDIKDLGKIVGADFSSDYLKEVLESEFGQDRLSDLSRKVLVPTFDLDNEVAQGRYWKMKFFHNFDGFDSDGQEKIVDVGLRTSAAPTYFPTYQGYIDGGVGCNNPSMASLSLAINKKIGNQSLKNVKILSISSGKSPTYISGDTLDWGLSQWAKPITSIMIDANIDVAHYQCEQFLGAKNYHRLDPMLPKTVSIAEIKRFDELIDWAFKVDIAPTVEWLVSNFI